jgi:hypothetical protein
MLQSRAARDLFRHRLLRLRTLERLVEIVDGSTPQEGK